MSLVACSLPEPDTSASEQAATVVSSEFPIDFLVFGPTGTQYGLAAASDGSGHLVVWSDARRTVDYSPDVYAARISPSGELLDPEGFVITPTTANDTRPQVAWNGSSYWVVSGMTYVPDTPLGMQAVQVGTDGAIGTPIPLSQTNWFDGTALACSSSGKCLVVGNISGWGEMVGWRLAPDGSLLDAQSMTIVGPGFRFQPAAACSPDLCFVVWTDNRDQGSEGYEIYGARVDLTQGTVLDPDGVLLANAASWPAVVFDGTQFIVAFAGGDLYGIRVTPQGEVLDSPALAIAVEPGEQRAPALVFDGAAVRAAWVDGRAYEYDQSEIYTARIDGQGNVTQVAPVPSSVSEMNMYVQGPALAAATDHVLISWKGTEKGYVQARRIDATNTPLDPAAIELGGGFDSQSPASLQDAMPLAFDGTGYLAVWVTKDFGVVATRLGLTGERLDPLPLNLAPGHQGYAPQVVWTGTNYLVLWQRAFVGPAIMGVRVSPDGAVLDPTPLLIAVDAGMNAIAANGRSVVLVFDSLYGLQVTNLGPSGGDLGGPIDTLSVTGYGARLVYEPSSQSYVALWVEADGGVYATQISDAGERVGPPNINTGLTSASLRLAAGGGTLLAAWYDINTYDVYAARLSPNLLQLIDGSPSLLASAGWVPELVYDGSRFQVVFSSIESGELFASSIDPSAPIVPPVPDPLGKVVGSSPVLATDGSGTILVGFLRNQAMANRRWGFLVTHDPPPDAGVVDAAIADAAPAVDAMAIVDAAGAVDAAVAVDAAAAVDAAVVLDAGVPQDAMPDETADRGCSVATTTGKAPLSGSGPIVVAVVVIGLGRRRSRTRRHGGS